MKLKSDEERLLYKQRLKEYCIAIIQERIDTAREAMVAAQEAANNEDKSSAGDKYETGRAMSQIDRDNFAKQLSEAQQEILLLRSIDTQKISDRVNNGAVIGLGAAYFFVASGIGMIQFEDRPLAVLSPLSPFATVMRGKCVGDRVLFNDIDFKISEIF